MAAALAATSVLAQSVPDTVGRSVRAFDFDERELGNVEPLPMGWEKVQGSGFPHYVNGELRRGVGRGDSSGFELSLDGGSVMYRYGLDDIIAVPGARYRMSVWVRTTALRSARAQLVASFIAADGSPMKATRIASTPMVSQNGEWQQLTIELPDAPVEAIAIEVALGLLQRDKLAGATASGSPDIRGKAWFDDLKIVQVPTLQLSTRSQSGVFGRSETVKLIIQVGDREAGDLSAAVDVRDASGTTRYQRSGPIAMRSEGASAFAADVDLPELPAGWYETSVRITSRGVDVGESRCSFVKLADDVAALRADARFGLIATQLSPAQWIVLPQIAQQLAAGRVKIAAWSEAGAIDETLAPAFNRLLEQLIPLGIRPTACLMSLPGSTGTSAASLETIAGGDEAWVSRFASMVAIYAAQVDAWQLLDDTQADTAPQRPALTTAARKLVASLETLSTATPVTLAWPAWYENNDFPCAFSLPTSVLPPQVPLYAAEHPTRSGGSLVLWPLAERSDRLLRQDDFAKRIVRGLASEISRIDIPLPAALDAAGRLQPTELWPVQRTLCGLLSGAIYRGPIALGEGVEAYLFDNSGAGLIVAWSVDGSARPITLDGVREPITIDLMGNLSRPEIASLKAGRSPIVLANLDAAATRCRASVAIDRPLLETQSRSQLRRLKFINTFDTPVNGSLRVSGPTGWTLTPTTSTFALSPGQSFETDLLISIPGNSTAGERSMAVSLELANASTPRMTVPLTVRLGLSDLGVQTIAYRDGNSVRVQQIISNYSDKPAKYIAFAVTAGQPRQERSLNSLAPGASVIKQYKFDGGDIKLVRAGVREIEGSRSLTEEVKLD